MDVRQKAFSMRPRLPYIERIEATRSGKMRVCVLGAGIAGLAAAWQLQCEGHEVTIVDRAQAGAGASGANGAQLSYAYVQPLADPALWSQLPKLLFSRNSPLTLRPRWDIDQWRWGVAFLAACQTGVSRRSTVQLLALAAESRRAFERLLAEQSIDCDFSASGKLVLYSDERSFAHARRQLALQQSLGVKQRAASGAECVEIEPTLAGYRRNIAGAIYTPGECAADCYKVCQELLRLLRAGGARTVFDTEVTGFIGRRGRVAAVETPAGRDRSGCVRAGPGFRVGAAGAYQGVYLPVYPLKGYSVTLPAGAAAPTVSVTDAGRKVVFARLGKRLRIAGMAELVGDDLSIPAARSARPGRGRAGRVRRLRRHGSMRSLGRPATGNPHRPARDRRPPSRAGEPALQHGTRRAGLHPGLRQCPADRRTAAASARAARFTPAAARPVPYSA